MLATASIFAKLIREARQRWKRNSPRSCERSRDFKNAEMRRGRNLEIAVPPMLGMLGIQAHMREIGGAL